METPRTYAAHLATYIASPTKIEAFTRIEFGKAPPLHEIAEMRVQVERSRKPFKNARRELYEVERGAAMKPHLPKRAKSKRDGTPKEPKPRAPYRAPVSVWCGVPVPQVARELIAEVAADFDIAVDEIVGVRRNLDKVHARSVVVRLLKERGWSLPRIGAVLGGRDHSTIINLYDKRDIYAARDARVSASYERNQRFGRAR